jgi:DNA repair exonuclease SbcCD nuclease subunit
MAFTFLHAADLHIDSPLESLGAKDAEVARRFAEAGRAAVAALIRETIESGAKFLVIAGDIYDGDWRDVSTGLFFARQLGELFRAGVPVFMIRGNHDAISLMSRGLPYPPNVQEFDSKRAETKLIEELRVALHGRSFGQRGVAEDFVQSYPARREGWLNIGVLHTSLDGKPGHDPYAPCTIADLRRFGYDYWALGHIHQAEIVASDPYVVFPGNLQGRSPRETGAKGAMRVTVDDGRIVAVEPIALDAARWGHATVDVAGAADEEEIVARALAALARAYGDAGGRPLAARLTLTGATALHARLVAHRERIEADLRARGFEIGAECWVERLRLATEPAPARHVAAPDELDVDALIAAAAEDPEFAASLAEIERQVAEKLPPALREEFRLDGAAARARDLLSGER